MQKSQVLMKFYSVEEAWVAAFRFFVTTGAIVVPQCNAADEKWFLTSKPQAALCSAKYWNQRGAYAGPGRECLRSDGHAKKIYPNQTVAELQRAKGDMNRHEVYCCSRGHWHIGKKMKRPILAR